MAFSLHDIQKGVKRMPRKIILYGPPKLGKSTLSGATKNALMIPTEDRVAHIKCDKTPVVENFEQINEIFDFLLNGKHTYKRVVVDTLDWLEPMIHDYAVRKLNERLEGTSSTLAKSINDDNCKETTFQKGLKFVAPAAWKVFLANCDILRDNGLDVILVAHSDTITVNPPDRDPYEKYVMKIHKHSLAVLEEWADIIAFYDKEIFVKKEKVGPTATKGKATTTKRRVLHLCGDNPAMISGNSFGLGDAVVDLENCTEIMEWMLTANNNQQ
jgi:hypothetical protein